MKIQKNITLAAAIAAVCLAAYSASAAADYIGFNFACNDLTGVGEITAPGGVLGWTTNVDALAPWETAGVPPLCVQSNWMNLGMYGTNVTLIDSNGAPTAVKVSWYALGMFHANFNGSYPLVLTNNTKLMDGFIECTWPYDQANVAIPDGIPMYSIPNTDQPIIYLTGLNSFLLAQGGGTYSIIIYVNTDGVGQGRVGQYFIHTATGTEQGITDTGTAISRDISTIPNILTPTPVYFVADTTEWAGTNQSALTNFTMVPVTATNSGNAAFGNYVEFDGLTNNTILIRTQNDGHPSAPINAIQIISLGVAIPPNPTTPAASPTNTVYGNSPVTLTETATGTPPITYVWQTLDDTSAWTNIPNQITNTLSLFMPDTGSQYSVQYTVILTNIYSYNVPPYQAATSAVCTITVLPKSAPIVTTDINIYSTNVFAFIGGNVQFHAEFNLGTMPITNQWIFKMDSGGGYTNLAGATGAYWTRTNVQSASAGLYKLTATNSAGGSSATPAHLKALAVPAAPPSNGVTNMYANCVMTNHPWAYWKFEETNDTLTSSMQAYDYSGHNFDATYGNSDGSTGSGCKDGGESVLQSQYGPIPSGGYSGFPDNNGCASMSYNHNNGYLYVPPLNLNTNTVTFTMWIYPKSSVFPRSTGLLMSRNGFDTAGIGFGTTTNGAQTPCLAYTWNNNSSATYSWNSGLFPVANVWNFVACVITPSNTVMYLYNVAGSTTNLYSAVHTLANTSEGFSGGTTWMGGDNWNNGLTFYGCIDEVAIFTNSLGEAQIQDLFLKAIGLNTGIAPAFLAQPTNATVFQGQTLVLSSLATGIPTPPTNGANGAYQWQVTNVSGAWQNYGSTLPTRLTTNATLSIMYYSGNYTTFKSIAKNSVGSAASSVATVTMVPVANWSNAVWTVNFAVATTSHGGPGTPYVGRGVLGTTNTSAYWNPMGGDPFKNTTSLRDDGVTPSGVMIGVTNAYINTFSSKQDYTNSDGSVDNLLLDQYAQVTDTNNGVNFFFTKVPKGIYNVALYGCVGAYVDRGVIFTVYTNGVSAGTQSVTNKQDTFFMPFDNTAVFTNLLVMNGQLQVNASIVPATSLHTNSTEGDFNGAQLELVTAGPDIGSITNSGTNMVLTWAGGGLQQSTNLMPGVGLGWVTNTAVSPYTFAPTGAQRFFRIVNYHFP